MRCLNKSPLSLCRPRSNYLYGEFLLDIIVCLFTYTALLHMNKTSGLVVLPLLCTIFVRKYSIENNLAVIGMINMLWKMFQLKSWWAWNAFESFRLII